MRLEKAARIRPNAARENARFTGRKIRANWDAKGNPSSFLAPYLPQNKKHANSFKETSDGLIPTGHSRYVTCNFWNVERERERERISSPVQSVYSLEFRKNCGALWKGTCLQVDNLVMNNSIICIACSRLIVNMFRLNRELSNCL